MNASRIESFRFRLAQGAVNGIFCKSTDPAFVEAAGKAGLDFAILDMEHGPADFKTMEHLVRASESTSMVSIIRTSANEPWMISRALDTGAVAVQIPNISSLQEAKKAVASARFHPDGRRGVCRFVRAADYGNQPGKTYYEESNRTLLILMIEGLQGISELDDILKLDGFDVVFVGPYDLSQSLGVPGEIDNPRIHDFLVEIAEKAKYNNKFVGTFYDLPERKSWLIASGIRYLAYSVDTEIFRQACIQIASDE